MTLSANPNRFETASAPASTYDGLREVWWYLNGSHPTTPNSIAWECLEVYDGTLREVPALGKLSSLNAANLWHPSTTSSLPEGAWGLFRNPGGVVAAKFQVFVRMEAAAQAGHSLVSLDDWTVGGGTGASPTLPATIIGQPASGNGDGRFPSSSTFLWSVIVDEGMFYMKQFAVSGFSTSARWTYMGEIDPVTDETDDPRPFVTPRNTNQSWSGTFSHVRLSPVDQSTIAELRNRPFYNDTQNVTTTYDDLGVEYLSNVAIDSENPVNHRFIQGYFRNVGSIDELAAANRATAGFDASDFRFEVFSQVAGRPGIVSLYPPGTALAGGHTLVTAESVPVQLPQAAAPAAALTTELIKTLRHLLPKSFPWNLVYARDFLRLIKGVVPSFDAARTNADEVWQSLLPTSTEGIALDTWERQFNLRESSSLTLQERRDRLAGAWAALGGQSPSYITLTLQSHGFAVFTHEWFVLSGSGYPVPRDPRDHLKAEFGGTDADGFLIRNVLRTSVKSGEIGAGEAFAEAGEEDALAGFFAGFAIVRIEATYRGPESNHPFYLYIGGETFPDTVDIPVARREEFEHLCQKICPAQQWLVLRVRYV